MSDKITIYDYQNNPIEVDLKGKTIKDIEGIHVIVSYGDENGWIEFKDGTELIFDADVNGNRMLDGEDHRYYVYNKETIEAWLNFKPTESTEYCIAEQRADAFVF